MKIDKFEDWLQYYYITQVNPKTIKDSFEDDYGRWTSDLEYDDYVKLGDLYGKAVEIHFVTSIRKALEY